MDIITTMMEQLAISMGIVVIIAMLVTFVMCIVVIEIRAAFYQRDLDAIMLSLIHI